MADSVAWRVTRGVAVDTAPAIVDTDGGRLCVGRVIAEMLM
jgi:hypothetical protein